MLPGSALPVAPLNTGVVSLVAPPLAIATGDPPSLLISCRFIAASGAVVSRVKLIADDAGPVFPAASVTVVVKLCAPGSRAGSGVNVQLPLLSTVAVPISAPLSNTVTVLPSSAEPLKTGVVSLVTPLVMATGVPLLSLLNTTVVAAAGAVVSTVKPIGADGALTLPAGSVTVAVRLWSPSLSVGVVYVHAPPASTITVPSTVVPSEMVTILPSSAEPLKVGVVSFVASPSAIAKPSSLLSETLAASAGGVTSTVNVNGSEAAPTLPAGSVSVTVRL